MTAGGSIENVCVTCGAAVKISSPTCEAVIEHVPGATSVT